MPLPLRSSRSPPLRRLAHVLLLTVGTGCLVPQANPEFFDLPPKVNSAPAIVGALPKQQQAVIYIGTPTAGCSVTDSLQVTVREPDISDISRSLWYIDPSTNSGPVSPASVVFGGSPDRVLIAPAALANQMSTLTDGRAHVVQVFVSDSEFTTSFPPQGVREPISLPDGGTTADPAYVVSYIWLITVERCQ